MLVFVVLTFIAILILINNNVPFKLFIDFSIDFT